MKHIFLCNILIIGKYNIIESTLLSVYLDVNAQLLYY